MHTAGRIAAITATTINLPATRSSAWSGGATSGATRSVIEIETTDGMRGLGEAPGDAACSLINSRLSPRLIGLSVLDRAAAYAICTGGHQDFGTLWDPTRAFAFGAIEMAMWDITAQCLGVPLYQALGGAVRKAAPFSAYAYTVDLADGYSEAEVPAVMAQIATAAIARTGAEMFEFKIGRHGLECDIATVLAIRDALGPDVALGVDANMGLTIAQARRFFDATRSARLANVEEPVASLAEMARLRTDFGVPISTHCTDFAALAAYPCIDGVVGDLHGNGGIAGNLITARIAQACGRQYWLRSAQETGIAFAAFCHVGMACPEMTRPAQTLIDWVEHTLTLGAPWQVQNGGVTPPARPGLGVELDRAALAEYAARYTAEGPLSYYDRP